MRSIKRPMLYFAGYMPPLTPHDLAGDRCIDYYSATCEAGRPAEVARWSTPRSRTLTVNESNPTRAAALAKAGLHA